MSEGFISNGTETFKVSNVELYLKEYPDVKQVSDPSANDPKETKNSITDSAIMAAKQGGTLGVLPVLEGVSNYAFSGDKPVGSFGGEMKSLGNYISKNQERYDKARQDNPATYAATDLISGIPAAILTPEVKIARGLSQVPKMIKSALPLLGIGAVEGATRTSGDIADRAKGAVAGVATMTVLPPVLKTLASKPIGRAAVGAGVGYVGGDALASVLPFGENRRDSDWSGAGAALGLIVGLNPSVALKAYSSIKSAGENTTTKETLNSFLELTPKGKILRKAAKEGDVASQIAIKEVTTRLDNMLGLEDTVLAYAHSGLKPEYVRSAMAVDWAENSAAPMLAKKKAEEKLAGGNVYRESEGWKSKLARKNAFQERYGTPTSLKLGTTTPQSPIGRKKYKRTDDVVQGMSDYETTGQVKTASNDFTNINTAARQNLVSAYESAQPIIDNAEKLVASLQDARMNSIANKLLNDIEKARKITGQKDIPDIADSGTKADAFIVLDNLKKRIWSTAKSLDGSPDVNAQSLARESWDVGTTLQHNLEDKTIWGKGASKLQTEINAVWHPWLTARKPAKGEKGFNRFLSHLGAEPSARIGRTRPETDPGVIKSFIESYGLPENALKEKIFRKGTSSSADLVEGLADKYAGGDALKALKKQYGENFADEYTPEELRKLYASQGIKPNLIETASKIRPEYNAIKNTLDETGPKLGAYRSLSELDKISVPLKPSTVVSGINTIENALDSKFGRGIASGISSTRNAIANNPSNVSIWNALNNNKEQSNAEKESLRIQSAVDEKKNKKVKTTVF